MRVDPDVDAATEHAAHLIVQQRVVVAVLALGKADGQPVDGAELYFNRFLQSGVHRETPLGCAAFSFDC
jgi:hypothetical protein